MVNISPEIEQVKSMSNNLFIYRMKSDFYCSKFTFVNCDCRAMDYMWEWLL